MMAPADFLAEMIERRRAAVAPALSSVMDAALAGFGRDTVDLFAALTQRTDIAVIAEFKKASPSVGDIALDAEPGAQAAAYEAGGAAAMSVLAEPSSFGGGFEDISLAREATALPILCKDFVVHHNQLLLARAAGADAVLLMVSVLGERTAAFVAAALERGLEPLVEVHGEDEYVIARSAGARVLGVNSRDLHTLDVDRQGSFALIERAARDGFCVVAESGMRSRTDVAEAAAAGAHAVLVGESLMRADDPAEAVRALTGVGRRDRAPS
jgi:indole-3-glycerol phosphate synthase